MKHVILNTEEDVHTLAKKLYDFVINARYTWYDSKGNLCQLLKNHGFTYVDLIIWHFCNNKKIIPVPPTKYSQRFKFNDKELNLIDFIYIIESVKQKIDYQKIKKIDYKEIKKTDYMDTKTELKKTNHTQTIKTKENLLLTDECINDALIDNNCVIHLRTSAIFKNGIIRAALKLGLTMSDFITYALTEQLRIISEIHTENAEKKCGEDVNTRIW